ncbi:FG-GAP-like repeat-containing protein [Hymenobacter terrenus]|uniref:FG-GAP-like repeat-containing protein n=1 Tax=Hymenobacter terrenus TaxID=1629124 RepID=UPI0018CF2EFF|nr:FG-GAP-like repeat-containing protein [Hymenobacter terrenus]
MKHCSTLPSRYLLLVILLSASLAEAQSPTVVGTALSPARNAIAAPRTAPVLVPFSQAINPATAGNIKIFSSQYGGQRTAMANTNGNTVTLVPTAPAGQSAAFKPGELLTVTVSAAVVGTSGAATAPYVYQFAAAATGGTGRFVTGAHVPVIGYDYSSDVRVGDLDGDGDLDFVTSSGLYRSFQLIPGKINVRINDGTGNFTAAPDITVPQGPTSVALGDVDADGDLDVVSANYGGFGGAGNTVSICLNNGTGLFSSPSNIVVGPYPKRLVLGDIDGDSDLDLVIYGGTLFQVLFNNGSGNFGGAVTLAPGNTGTTEIGPALADMDGDGDLDIIGPDRLYRNNGQGAFTAVTGGMTTYYRNDVLGDVDGDGDLDLVTTARARNSLFITLNDGNGSSSASKVIPTAASYTPCVALGDLDGDGDLDLMAPVFTNNLALNVWLNDGLGNFSATPTRLGNTQAMDRCGRRWRPRLVGGQLWWS